MFFWDPTMILLIPALILAFYAQFKVRSAYKKFSQVRNMRGMTGYQAAMHILQMNNLSEVNVEEVPGQLSDHYDPRDKTVRLSSENFRGASVAAVSIAAHEVGHAIQDAVGYAPLKFRHSILPMTNIGSWVALPLFFAGFIFGNSLLVDIGIILFAGVVVFHLVTLPVEFNASNRAIAQLAGGGYITREETQGAKKVLNAAALTYVAATAVSAMHLIRLLILRNAMDD